VAPENTTTKKRRKREATLRKVLILLVYFLFQSETSSPSLLIHPQSKWLSGHETHFGINATKQQIYSFLLTLTVNLKKRDKTHFCTTKQTAINKTN
jgi:hypothetical protein